MRAEHPFRAFVKIARALHSDALRPQSINLLTCVVRIPASPFFTCNWRLKRCVWLLETVCTGSQGFFTPM